MSTSPYPDPTPRSCTPPCTASSHSPAFWWLVDDADVDMLGERDLYERACLQGEWLAVRRRARW